MDIENKFEQEIVFKLENKFSKNKKMVNKKKIFKLATENMKKMMMDRLEGKTGEC